LGKASGTILGLQFHSDFVPTVETNLEEIFLHLDLLKERDYASNPNPLRLGHGDTISQNSPNLSFIINKFGPSAFEEINEEDNEETLYQKEFALEVWDFARTLLPDKNISRRLDSVIDLITKKAPKAKSIHILSLSYIENFDSGLSLNIWEKLLNLKHLSEMTLQVNHLVQFAELIKCVGTKLEKICVEEMIGERDETSISSIFEGLDLSDQGALFICQNCPYVKEMDLVSVNYIRKFFFGRQIETTDGHFKKLQKLSIGKIDWNSFLQLWKLIKFVRELNIETIVPIFTLNEQLFEEHKSFDIFDIRDLFDSNKMIKNYLMNLQISTFRFATFEALQQFLLNFKYLKTVGFIDIESFSSDERKNLQTFAEDMKRQNGLHIDMVEMFPL